MASINTALRLGIGAALIAGGLLMAQPATAQADGALDAAKAQGLVGEQADGYVGLVPGANVPADVRARVDQVNIRRRAAYTQRAQARNVSVQDMAAAVACEIFEARISVGHHYRNEAGRWVERGAGQPVQMPSYCG
ncbi:MAG: YdbL family protein [Hyphomonadaceae bacterium]